MENVTRKKLHINFQHCFMGNGTLVKGTVLLYNQEMPREVICISNNSSQT